MEVNAPNQLAAECHALLNKYQSILIAADSDHAILNILPIMHSKLSSICESCMVKSQSDPNEARITSLDLVTYKKTLTSFIEVEVSKIDAKLIASVRKTSLMGEVIESVVTARTRNANDYTEKPYPVLLHGEYMMRQPGVFANGLNIYGFLKLVKEGTAITVYGINVTDWENLVMDLYRKVILYRAINKTYLTEDEPKPAAEVDDNLNVSEVKS